MNQLPKKRRWQFSLKVLLIVMAMAGVGMGMMRLSMDLEEQGLRSEGYYALCSTLGWILLSASPGVLIGYGYNRFLGAMIGGIASFFLVSVPVYAWVSYKYLEHAS